METSPVRKFEKKVGKNVKKKKTRYKTKSEEKVQKRKIGHKICMTLIGLRYFVVFNYFLISENNLAMSCAFFNNILVKAF